MKMNTLMLFKLFKVGARIGTYLPIDPGSKAGIMWLDHYLGGSGSELNLDPRWVESVFQDLYNGPEVHIGETIDFPFHSTTLYVGRGFFKRPALFYTVGCFTATVTRKDENNIVVSIADRYDWHPTKKLGGYRELPAVLGHAYKYWQKYGSAVSMRPPMWVEELSKPTYIREESWFYFTTPMPPQLMWLHKILNKLGGDRYFPTKGMPMGEPGISNKLFADFEKVGARPFMTTFQGEIYYPEYRGD